MLYKNKIFTLPSNTARISKELYEYRLGIINKEEYYKRTGEYPDSLENGHGNS